MTEFIIYTIVLGKLKISSEFQIDIRNYLVVNFLRVALVKQAV
jgi:hypothetical protein